MTTPAPVPGPAAPAKSNNTTILLVVGGMVFCTCSGIFLLFLGPPIAGVVLALVLRETVPPQPVVIERPQTTAQPAAARVHVGPTEITIDGRVVTDGALKSKLCEGMGPLDLETASGTPYARVIMVMDAASECHREVSLSEAGER